MEKSKFSGEFVFEPPETVPVGSVLYQEHLKLTGKSHITAFAGYLMPLWYSSVSSEHNAVRQTAGIFDCTHMGVLEIAGTDATGFLNAITTNEINNLAAGGAQYSCILDAAGSVLDDIIIYRRSPDKFMMVVNAANKPKIKAYLEALKNDQVVVDADGANRKLNYKPAIRDMRASNAGCDCRVGIALQGPAAMNVLFAVAEDKKLKERIENLKSLKFIEAAVQDIECLISRTGYTGAKIGFELFVHPEKAPHLWQVILQNPRPLGLMPCGLGARDSLRIEAGLPLYGHELAGQFNISPFEAGCGWVVKLKKPFFIGKAAAEHRARTYNMKVARVELSGTKGIRPVRQNDAVLNSDGKCIGFCLSSAKAGEKQIALVYVITQAIKEGDSVGIYYLARSRSQIEQGRNKSVEKGQILDADIVGTAVSRFAKF